MPTVDVLSPSTGKKVGTRDLSAEFFGAKVSVPLMHQVVVAGMASLRRGTHSVKTRGEVSGGGRKPWRQKGTGRARQGSTRAPQWTGGGVVHGPHPRDHDMRVNKKMRRSALRSALTDAHDSGKLVVLDDLDISSPKTKDAAAVLDTLDLEGKVLLVLPSPTETGSIEKSFRNLEGVRIAYARSLGVYELIAADRVVFTQAALDAVEGASTGADGGSSTQRTEPSTDAPVDGPPAQPPAATDDSATDDSATDDWATDEPGGDDE
jgi:large subunit ribosomal protein L4